MNAPNKIYVNISGDYWHPGTDEKVNTDIEYIRKDALLELVKETYFDEKTSVICQLYYKQLINKIESL